MKLSIALGIAAAALTVAAASAQSSHRVVISNGASDINLDANGDGWVTRAEAAAAYERIFADLDTNHDGKLDDADRAARRERHADVSRNVHVFSNGDGHEVRVISGDLDEETRARVEREIDEAMSRADAEMERAERQSERAERNAERAERDAERAAERAERHVHRIHADGNREVIIIRSNGEGGTWVTTDGEVAPLPPAPPVPPVPGIAPVPPVPPAMPFMMLIANSEEADRDGDGALSREEFVAMHMRFFDASDANGDGRIRFEAPTPPAPPAAPTPPEPPRRR
ncbi:MAG: hypothetical protein R3C31_07790 [Hyphomonadaceae bacterium]